MHAENLSNRSIGPRVGASRLAGWAPLALKVGMALTAVPVFACGNGDSGPSSPTGASSGPGPTGDAGARSLKGTGHTNAPPTDAGLPVPAPWPAPPPPAPPGEPVETAARGPSFPTPETSEPSTGAEIIPYTPPEDAGTESDSGGDEGAEGPPTDAGAAPADAGTNPNCALACAFRACGLEPVCGRNCGECPGGQPCSPEGACLCVPDCSGRACGDDGCGGSCGTCPGLTACVSGACVCDPQCEGRACGHDGCGGSCGACGAGQICAAGQCAPRGPCPPDTAAIPGMDVCIDQYEAVIRAGPGCAGQPLWIGPPQPAEAALPPGVSSEGVPGTPATGAYFACPARLALPSRGVTWNQAKRACENAGKTLCAFAAWSAACSGPSGQDFPYGADYQVGLCNEEESGLNEPAPSGSFGACEGGVPGLFDMMGNVREWTATAAEGTKHTVVGTSYSTAVGDPATVACPFAGGATDKAAPNLGFRCCY